MDEIMAMMGWPSLGAEDVAMVVYVLFYLMTPLLGFALLIQFLRGVFHPDPKPGFFFQTMGIVVAGYFGFTAFQHLLGHWFPAIGYGSYVSVFNTLPYGWIMFSTAMIVVFLGVVILGGALLITLYQKWVLGELTEAERQPGIEGIRAWLSEKNLLCVVGLSILLSIIFSISFLEALVQLLLIVLAWPLLAMVSSVSQSPARLAEDLHASRQKILELLEKGTISVEESRELLLAIGDNGKR